MVVPENRWVPFADSPKPSDSEASRVQKLAKWFNIRNYDSEPGQARSLSGTTAPTRRQRGLQKKSGVHQKQEGMVVALTPRKADSRGERFRVAPGRMESEPSAKKDTLNPSLCPPIAIVFIVPLTVLLGCTATTPTPSPKATPTPSGIATTPALLPDTPAPEATATRTSPAEQTTVVPAAARLATPTIPATP